MDNPASAKIWEKGLWPSIRSVVSILPSAVWSHISPQFYVTFWQLSLYDIYVPTGTYSAEIAKNKAVITRLEREISGSTNSKENSKRRKEKDRSLIMIQNLEKELKVQQDNYEAVQKRLLLEKDSWFYNCK